MMRSPAFIALLIVIAATSVALADTISGAARVVDGDTVIVGNVRVRLNGVDAAEMNTDLGRVAKVIMQTIVNGGPLRCELTGERTWKREVGFCFTEDGTDIGQEIIAQGAALSCPRYSTRYLKFELADALALQSRSSYCVGRR
jgi:endonuclease YncB( thermonuclease family)